MIGIDLDETQIGDDGLADLEGLTDLQSLSLDGTPDHRPRDWLV